MALPNDSITVTPGAGATVATQLADGKELQVVAPADAQGHLQGTKDTWVVSTGNTIHVAAARTTLFDLFNASGSGVVLRVVGLYVIPALAAVTGVGQTYQVIRTTAVGTGGTALTPLPFDTDSPALPSQVTARVKPSGGATGSTVTLFLNGSSEETIPYASLASVLNHIPQVQELAAMKGLKLKAGEGLKVDQTTNSAVGNVNVVAVFTVE
jgi:hypothetical protein